MLASTLLKVMLSVIDRNYAECDYFDSLTDALNEVQRTPARQD